MKSFTILLYKISDFLLVPAKKEDTFTKRSIILYAILNSASIFFLYLYFIEITFILLFTF